MSADVTETLDVRLPHTRRQHAEAAPTPPRPFSGGGSLLPPDLVHQLLAAGDEHDPRLAYVLAVIAGWAYSDAETMANKLKYYGLPEVTVEAIAVTNPAMLIVASAFLIRSRCGRLGILAFRGTEPANAINWLTDTDLVQRPLSLGSVHQGFHANLQAVWEEICGKLEDAVTGSKARRDGTIMAPLQRLYVTGHSLGAAMAVLAAARLATADTPAALRSLVHGVYTFGQPAVGDRDFADEFDPIFGHRLYRHVYACDVVPCLPPAWDGRFVHFGAELVSTGAAWTTPARPGAQARWLVSALASCATSFVSRRLPYLERLDFPYSLDDHSPTRYIEASRAGLPAVLAASTDVRQLEPPMSAVS